MKKILVTVLAALLLCGWSFGQTPGKKSARSSKSAQQVLALNSAWAEAITRGDASALERIFAADIVVISGSGEIRNKAGEIKDAASAPDPDFIWIHPFATEDVQVRIYQDAAVVTGLAKWTFKYKGPEVNQERRYTHVYVKRSGRWQIVSQQVSSNLYKPPASS